MERRPSSAASSLDGGSERPARMRKSMLREAVAMQCVLATVRELEEAHEALRAGERLKEKEKGSRQNDEQLAALRAQLQAKDEALLAQAEQAVDGAEVGRKQLEELEARYGAQLGAMTQKNAQMRVDLKQ